MNKMRWLITIPFILLTLSGGSIYAEEPENVLVFTDLHAAGARSRAQVDYVSMVAQVTLKFIDDYWAQYQRPVPEKIFNEFVNGLLINDPIVRKVYYVPKKFLTFIMHSRTVHPVTSVQDAPFVEPMLLGKTLVYRFENEKWVLDKEKSTVPWFANSDMYHLTQSLQGSLVEDKARIHLQADYAFKVVTEFLNFLKVYRVQYQQAVPIAAFSHFVDFLLKNGTDPIISAIQYVPEQSFVVILQNTPFVEPELRGKTLSYRFVKDTWVFDSEKSTVPQPIVAFLFYHSSHPASLDVPDCKIIITDHCQIYPKEFPPSDTPPPWSDSEWCPYWSVFVAPSEQL